MGQKDDKFYSGKAKGSHKFSVPNQLVTCPSVL